MIVMGLGRRAWAQVAANPARYAKLNQPVRIALGALTMPWQLVAFKAEAMAPVAGATPARRVILSGVVFRRAGGDQRPALSALCVTCTHEQCEVDFVEQPGTLPRMDRPIDHPCSSAPAIRACSTRWTTGRGSRGPPPAGCIDSS